MTRSHPPHTRAPRALRAAALLMLTALLASCASSNDADKAAKATTTVPAGFAGYVRTPLVDVSAVSLPTVDKKPVRMVAAPDSLLIVYFGYASCPDVCPMTLTLLKNAVSNLPPADRKRVQAAMVTVDLSRDTPDIFGGYVEQYFPSGLALRATDAAELRVAVDAFGADFRIQINKQGQREVSHSDELYVVDDTGKIILAWPYGLTSQAISADLSKLLAGERPDA